MSQIPCKTFLFYTIYIKHLNQQYRRVGMVSGAHFTNLVQLELRHGHVIRPCKTMGCNCSMPLFNGSSTKPSLEAPGRQSEYVASLVDNFSKQSYETRKVSFKYKGMCFVCTIWTSFSYQLAFPVLFWVDGLERYITSHLVPVLTTANTNRIRRSEKLKC